MKRHPYIAGFVLALVILAAFGAAQSPTTRWQYAETYMMQDSATGKMQWTVGLPDGRFVRGEKVADLARQLNVQGSQEGLMGVYNLMGAMGYELAMPGRDSAGVTSSMTIYKKPV